MSDNGKSDGPGPDEDQVEMEEQTGPLEDHDGGDVEPIPSNATNEEGYICLECKRVFPGLDGKTTRAKVCRECIDEKEGVPETGFTCTVCDRAFAGEDGRQGVPRICSFCYQDWPPKIWDDAPPRSDIDTGAILDFAREYLETLRADKLSARPPRCGEHCLEPLHKDREHAILFCHHCGLIRVVELTFTEDGKVPVCDVPNFLGLQEDWPKLGAGSGEKESKKEGIVLLKRFLSLAARSVEDLPLEPRLVPLYEEVDEYISGLDE